MCPICGKAWRMNRLYVPMEDLVIDDKPNYIEKPVAILDRKVKQLRNKTINQVKFSAHKLFDEMSTIGFLQIKGVKGIESNNEGGSGTRRLGKEILVVDNPSGQGKSPNPST
ncbi:hypothetical protein E3N88_04196 [Mikania micrantha]|uniref:Uncharacterized protein n=1 Tax=Mikania micrantha TaxID=192012 RepID=A0A5N6PVX8_9ASTR|nr:hypothetical protein E3N88_04196 [Mikania micrantha]